MTVAEECIAVDGAVARYRTAGTGRAVLLVHGLGLSSRLYERNIEELAAAGFRVVAPDLPGFGGTPGPRTGSSVAENAVWLANFARALGIRHGVWIGHSISCQCIMALAAAEPHLADALVLIAPTGAPGRGRRLWQFLQFLRNAPREPLRAIRDVAHEYIRTSPAKYIGSWLRSFADHPLSRRSAIRCPVLIVVGARDPVIPRDYVSLLRAGLPDARVARIPGGAHGVPFDRHSEMDARVIAWLRGVFGAGQVGVRGGSG